MSSPIQLGGPNSAPVMELNGLTYPLQLGNPETVATAGLGGATRNVKTAAATLTAADSGALCLFNLAAGFLYTLPAAQKGLYFDFAVTVTVTSSVARIACALGDFFIGTILQGCDGTFVLNAVTANGTTHLAWEGNGSTTGGIIGDTIRVTAISDTQWAVTGINTATGTEATPFKTS